MSIVYLRISLQTRRYGVTFVLTIILSDLKTVNSLLLLWSVWTYHHIIHSLTSDYISAIPSLE